MLKFFQKLDGQQQNQPRQLKSYGELEAYMRKLGMEDFESLFFLDFSRSNLLSNNHQIDQIDQNPYYQVLEALSGIVGRFDQDQIFPVFRFGCIRTKDKGVIPLNWLERNQSNFEWQQANYNKFPSVIQAYKEAVNQVTLSGPTSIVPISRASIEYSKRNPGKHILSFILCDGELCSTLEDRRAIIEASSYPISFMVISVGPTNDESIESLTKIRARRFDNVRVVYWHDMVTEVQKIEEKLLKQSAETAPSVSLTAGQAVASQLFAELPKQFIQMVKEGLLPETTLVKTDGLQISINQLEKAVKEELHNHNQ